MLTSTVAVLAFAALAYASPQSTYCYEDNLLRAFQHTPTPASGYCVTATGYPTFLAVTSYPPTRLSSACSCFSRFPAECATPLPKAGTDFTFSSTSTVGTKVNILLTIDLGTTCRNGYAVTGICGTLGGAAASFKPGDHNLLADNCFYPGGPGVESHGEQYNGVDYEGVAFQTPGNDWNIFYDVNSNTLRISNGIDSEQYAGFFQPATCATCPT